MTNSVTDHRCTDRCAGACSCVAAVAVEDLQGPVAELRGYLEALARSDGRADPRLLRAAREAGDRVRDVVDALAAYDDADRPARRRPVELTAVVAAAAELLADETADRPVRVHVGPLPQLRADPQQLYRAIVALLRQVAAAHPDGTELSVGALHRGDEWQLRVGARRAGRPVPAEPEAARVRSPEGGVDLLTAQRVAEAHDGHVWFTDTGDGPVAWLTLPDRPAGPR